jgi:hypothetical protein
MKQRTYNTKSNALDKTLRAPAKFSLHMLCMAVKPLLQIQTNNKTVTCRPKLTSNYGAIKKGILNRLKNHVHLL